MMYRLHYLTDIPALMNRHSSTQNTQGHQPKYHTANVNRTRTLVFGLPGNHQNMECVAGIHVVAALSLETFQSRLADNCTTMQRLPTFRFKDKSYSSLHIRYAQQQKNLLASRIRTCTRARISTKNMHIIGR